MNNYWIISSNILQRLHYYAVKEILHFVAIASLKVMLYLNTFQHTPLNPLFPIFKNVLSFHSDGHLCSADLTWALLNDAFGDFPRPPRTWPATHLGSWILPSHLWGTKMQAVGLQIFPFAAVPAPAVCPADCSWPPHSYALANYCSWDGTVGQTSKLTWTGNNHSPFFLKKKYIFFKAAWISQTRLYVLPQTQHSWWRRAPGELLNATAVTHACPCQQGCQRSPNL